MKDEFYDNLAGEYHNIANVRDREQHSRKRKYFSNAFALKTVVELDPIIHRLVALFLERIDSAAKTKSTTDNPQSLNINKWVNFFTFDVIGEFAVGKCFGFLENGSDTTLGQFKNSPRGRWHSVPSTIDALHSAFNFKVALGQLPRKWYLTFFKLLSWTNGKRNLDMFTSVAINQVRQRLDKSPDGSHTDFFDRVLLDRDGKSRHLPFMELVSEGIVLFNAGSDTTSSGLTSLIYEIARDPRIQVKLQTELAGAFNGGDSVASFEEVSSLPYLKACLDENLRLNPPIPYGPPRTVVDPTGVLIAGHRILPGTTVSVPTHSMHRLADIFPDPLVFRPERWLEVTNDDTKARMQNAFIPFSLGPRSCLGRNLAMMEQQVLLASLFHNYEVQLADPSFTPKRFEAFNLDPGPLLVILKSRRSSFQILL